MNLDIRTAVLTAFVLALIGFFLCAILGIQSIRAGQKLLFFRKRRDLMMRGWRLIFAALMFVIAALVLNRFAEPVVYTVFPPSPTVTDTPTITLTPTISLTPTITETPTITNTPSITDTPQVPDAIQVQFTSVVTPNPESVFSPIQFSLELDKDKLPLDPATEFKNPISSLFAFFSYDKMDAGAQWTALWYRLSDKTLICFETIPWNGSTGGYGFSECKASLDMWQPGEYEVQLFVGQEWKSSGRFTLTGDAPKPTATPAPTRTPQPTRTPTLTRTPMSTYTPTNTRTPMNTLTPTQTRTSTNTPGPSLTPTPRPTFTPSLTPTPRPTLPPSKTPLPTWTLAPSKTPKPTMTRQPTLTSHP